MRPVDLVCVALLSLGTDQALALPEIGTGSPTGKPISLRQLAENPRDYVGEKVVLPSIGCVNNPKSGFTCAAIVAGQALRIQASALGPKTRIEVAERLTRGCKGTANVTRAECRVDAEIQPTNVDRDTMDTDEGSRPIVLIYSQQIEMYQPKRPK